MSALHTVRLPLRVNVPAQRTWQMNAFATLKGEKTATRYIAKLVWTLVNLL